MPKCGLFPTCDSMISEDTFFVAFFFFEEYFGTIGGKWHISPIGPLYTCHIMPMQKELMLNKKVAKKKLKQSIW